MFIMPVMFDDGDSSGIIEAMLTSSHIAVEVDGRIIKVDPYAAVRELEAGIAKWLVENNEVLIPRQELARAADDVFRKRACGSNKNCKYIIYDESDKMVSLDEALDTVLLRRSNIYQVYAGTYVLLPLDTRFWRYRGGQRLWYFLNVVSKLVELFAADGLGIVMSYGDLVYKIAEAYCRLFLGGECKNPIELYYRELAKFYDIPLRRA